MKFILGPFGVHGSCGSLLWHPEAAAGATVPTSDSGSGAAGSTTPPGAAPAPTPPSSGTPTPPAVGATAPPAGAIARPVDEWQPPTRDAWTSAENARRAATRRAQQLETELKAERARVQALAGVTPPSPEAEVDAQIAAAFYEKFPQFKIFAQPGVVERLERLLTMSGDFEQASNHTWDRLATRTLDTLASRVADEMSVDAKAIDPAMRREIAALFHQMAAEDPQGFQKRYEGEDPTLIDAFVERFTKRWIEPLRRSAVAGMVRGQPRVPSGGSTRPVVSAPPTFDAGSRESTEDAAVAYLKAHGGFQGPVEA